MSVELQVISWVLGVLFSLGGGAWALMRAFAYLVNRLVAQFEARLDERFDALERSREEGRKVWDDRIKSLEKRQDETDRDVRKILIELPREYVRREDHIRFETVINAKLDALYSEMRLMAERQQRA